MMTIDEKINYLNEKLTYVRAVGNDLKADDIVREIGALVTLKALGKTEEDMDKPLKLIVPKLSKGDLFR